MMVARPLFFALMRPALTSSHIFVRPMPASAQKVGSRQPARSTDSMGVFEFVAIHAAGYRCRPNGETLGD